jgi:glyoxylase-like metal-dependent hydrolase (beta-lactamase superfamily II)
MRMQWAVIAGLTLAMSPAQAQQPSSLAAAANAMGTVNSIQYTATGLMYGFGQAFEPGGRWPKFIQSTYAVSINYQTPSMRLVTGRRQGESPPRGGATQPIAGEQNAINVLSDKYAWTEGGGPQAAPNQAGFADRLLQLWTTPHGVIKAAQANSARVDGNTVSFTVEGRAVKATLNAQNLVDKVTYLSSNEVVGDYPIEISYSDYADFGGIKFPRHIVQTDDGHPTLDIMVSEVKANPPVSETVPANVQIAGTAVPAPKIGVEKLAEGVWYLTTPNQRSWAVEFKDYAVVVEGIGSEARNIALLDEVAKLIPGKPVRYVINTHAHYDHAGGLRTYVAKGITVVTHETNKAFYEQAWARPHTVIPDLLSKSPRPATFETVSDKKVITDGTRSIELYFMKGTSHQVANLLVFMPKEGLLYWGDGYNPPQGNDPRDLGRTPEQMIDLYRIITTNNLDVKTLAPAHGFGPKPYDDLKKAIGLMPL